MSNDKTKTTNDNHIKKVGIYKIEGLFDQLREIRRLINDDGLELKNSPLLTNIVCDFIKATDESTVGDSKYFNLIDLNGHLVDDLSQNQEWEKEWKLRFDDGSKPEYSTTSFDIDEDALACLKLLANNWKTNVSNLVLDILYVFSKNHSMVLDQKKPQIRKVSTR